MPRKKPAKRSPQRSAGKGRSGAGKGRPAAGKGRPAAGKGRSAAGKGRPAAGKGKRSATDKPRGGKSSAGNSGDSAPQRLQRLLAAAGFGSRRQCEELIEAGRVEVDGQIVTRLGTSVDPATSKIRVDGDLLKKQKLVYYAVNKPVGFVTTNRDPQGRPRVVDLVPPDERVFPVGRLDRNSEGLILLTNDGELAQRLAHPKFGVRKIYRVTVAGKVDGETMKQMRKGIYISEGFVRVEGAKLVKSRSRSTEMEIILREGKNREIRRILARLGHKVQHLRRIAVGPLRLGDLPSGAYRIVSHREIEKLRASTESSGDSQRGPRENRRSKSAGKRGTDASRGRKTSTKGRGTTSGRKRTTTKAAASSLPLDAPSATGIIIGAESESTNAAVKPRTKRNAKRKASGKKKGASSSTRRPPRTGRKRKRKG